MPDQGYRISSDGADLRKKLGDVGFRDKPFGDLGSQIPKSGEGNGALPSSQQGTAKEPARPAFHSGQTSGHRLNVAQSAKGQSRAGGVGGSSVAFAVPHMSCAHRTQNLQHVCTL